MKKRILCIEPYSGVSGDMFAGALLDLVKDKERIFEEMKGLSIAPHFSLSLDSVERKGIRAEKFNVQLISCEGHQYGRPLSEIIAIINSAKKLPSEAKELAIRIFKRLAEAEAKIHHTEMQKIHFHEIGAIDSIVDIVTSSLAFCSINPDIVISRPVALGKGRVNSSHGILPLPAPATLEILKEAPVEYLEVEGELTTPTGAAIIKEITTLWNQPFSGKIVGCGYGAGTKELPDRPNILRISLLEEESTSLLSDTVSIIETNIDDMPGEFLSHIGEGLLEIGCLDYSVIPITMKKNRQGFILQAICHPDKLDTVSEYILENTPTIGLRHREERRKIMERKNIKISTSYGEVNTKLAYGKDGLLSKFKLELDDISRIAKKQKQGFQQIYSTIFAEIFDKLKSHKNKE